MENSYFVHKLKMKEKIKEILEEIKDYEKSIEILKSIEYPEYENTTKFMIEFLIKHISEIKDEFKKKSYIYFYG